MWVKCTPIHISWGLGAECSVNPCKYLTWSPKDHFERSMFVYPGRPPNPSGAYFWGLVTTDFLWWWGTDTLLWVIEIAPLAVAVYGTP